MVGILDPIKNVDGFPPADMGVEPVVRRQDGVGRNLGKDTLSPPVVVGHFFPAPKLATPGQVAVVKLVSQRGY